MAGFQILLSTTLWLSFFYNVEALQKCGRLPSEYTAPRSFSAGRFRLKIQGNPESYIPDANYTVSVEGETFNHQTQRFKEFNLIVEALGNGFDAGKFELRDQAQTKFSEECRNMIKQTTKSYKERVSVQWTAPPTGSGCVKFRTTIIVRKDTWFQDDEPLTKVLCEDHQKVFDEQPSVLEECSACSEATYEVTFEGLWSRHTHPNNFPQDLFQTRFSKIIGAAHNKDYNMWEYEKEATDGFKEVAENGDITALEAELKTQGSNIRTIIRAPGIGHPDAVKKTFATFRTTPEHHLMSLVSMIVPSPDWIVGVSKLELCLENRSWVDKRTLNLFPWDAGTDSGTTYESPDDPTIPRDIIRRITSDTPNTPFYDESGEPMKPLARLQVVRLNLFEKNCEDMNIEGKSEENRINANEEEQEESMGRDRDLCSVTNWSEWTECSYDCETKTGYRSRHRKNKVLQWLSEGCNKTLVDMEKCYVENNTCWNPNICSVSSWTDWSSCYRDLGSECLFRRRYRHITGGEECKNAQNKPDLLEIVECDGNQPKCKTQDPIETQELTQTETPKNCIFETGDCNVTCGQGFREVKFVKVDGYDEGKECDEYPPNIIVPCDTGITCSEGESTLFPNMEIGNQQNGYESGSPSPVTDCQVSRWSDWSDCSPTCGKSYKHRSRKVMIYPQNGGKPCPKKLLKRRRCNVPACGGDIESNEDPHSDADFSKTGCKYSNWTPWSECTVTCGEGMKQKARSVIDKAPGAQCDKRTKTRMCVRPACRQHSL